MNITSTIALDDLTTAEQEHIILLFANEDTTLANNRASYTITEGEGSITFQLQANDAVALRAMLTSISKTLATYTKMKGLTQP